MPPDELPEAELHPAFMWDCDKCGEENFVRAVSHLLDPNDPTDRETIDEVYGPGAADDLVADCSRKIVRQMCPSEVECDGCGAEFDTANPFGSDDEEPVGGRHHPGPPSRFVLGVGAVVSAVVVLLFLAGVGLMSLFRTH